MSVIRTKGTTIELAIATVLTKIAQVVKIKIPDRVRTDIDITELEDDAKRFVAGIKDSGVAEFEIHYDPEVTTHAALETSFNAGTTEEWSVVFPNASEVNFDGYINKFNPGTEAAEDGKFIGTLAVRIDGDVTIVP